MTGTVRVGPATPVTICQLEPEFEQALDLYRAEQPARVLEIGTASGGTLYHWLRNAQPGSRVVTVDLPQPDYPDCSHLFESWKPVGVELVPLRGSSHDPAIIEICRLLGKYQWLFIDGSHKTADCRQDWADYSALVEPGGLILLHDIALERSYEDGTHAGVRELWAQIKAEHAQTWEFVAAPELRQYGIGVVRLPA